MVFERRGDQVRVGIIGNDLAYRMHAQAILGQAPHYAGRGAVPGEDVKANAGVQALQLARCFADQRRRQVLLLAFRQLFPTVLKFPARTGRPFSSTTKSGPNLSHFPRPAARAVWAGMNK